MRLTPFLAVVLLSVPALAAPSPVPRPPAAAGSPAEPATSTGTAKSSATLSGWTVTMTPPAALEAPKGPSEERLALDKLTAENAIVREEVAKRLRALIEEKEELRIRHETQVERQKAEFAKLEAEFQRLGLENRLLEERNKKSVEDLTSQQRRVSAENMLDEELHRKELADVRQSREKLQQENDLTREKLRAAEMTNNAEKMALDLEMQRLSADGMRLKSEREILEDKLARLRNDIESRTRREEWRNEANREPVVLKEPFEQGVLTISDRRISLNGVIVRGVSDFVSERIDYLNNVSDDPIFLVIDRCPGGSVMEGYRIVKAMQSSKAPVHVVVKSFAASMCAVITTLAARSYVYPNAIILHHQMSTVLWGNMTQNKEQLEIAKEWWRRLAEPVAKRMGTDLDGLVKRMYAKNSDGDWEEFGDGAVAVKWATHLVNEVRETGVVKKPDDAKKPNPGLTPFSLEERSDEKGERYMRLPRLDPFDLYWVYNPDRYYR